MPIITCGSLATNSLVKWWVIDWVSALPSHRQLVRAAGCHRSKLVLVTRMECNETEFAYVQAFEVCRSSGSVRYAFMFVAKSQASLDQ
jgi:hypothetical protein